MKRAEYNAQVAETLDFFKNAHIALTEDEKNRIEVADFGLGRVRKVGLQLLTYINTQRVCAKEMVLVPFQTCPEHWHVGTEGMPGKEETFRCRKGVVYLYVDGEGTKDGIKAEIPETDVTVFHEVILNEGEQFTIVPGTKHWFQAGKNGAIVSEFSTRSSDETDVFTDKSVIREVTIED